MKTFTVDSHSHARLHHAVLKGPAIISGEAARVDKIRLTNVKQEGDRVVDAETFADITGLTVTCGKLVYKPIPPPPFPVKPVEVHEFIKP
jgi:hypothetical protein